MTRAKLRRMRIAYNRERRVLKGWVPGRWDEIVSTYEPSEFCWWLRRHWGIA